MDFAPRLAVPDASLDAALDAVAERLAAAERVVVLTGAGASAESGIPTFRDALTGHWAHHAPEDLATEGGFARDPEGVQAWYRHRLAGIRAAAPNAGHASLAALEGLVPSLTLVTQNVDGLHERAGSRRVLALHGRLDAGRCFTCALPAPLVPGEEAVRCSTCGGYVRPGVVWFGEALPAGVYAAALAASEGCDVFLSVGTSGTVYPAAALAGHAHAAGAFVAEINPVPTGGADAADAHLRGPSARVLPALVARVRQRRSA